MEITTMLVTWCWAHVLILIIMEDTHGVTFKNACYKAICCLNPYYNGRYSWRVKTHISLKTK